MREKMSKQPPPAPTASAIGPCPTIIQTSRTPRHWQFTQHLRTTRPPPCLRVKDSYVPLLEDCHIASIVRIKSKVVLKPHTAFICKGMVKNNLHVPESSTYQASAVEQSFINNKPGLQVSNSVIKLNRSRCFRYI